VCESSNQDGFSALRERKELRMRSCVKLLLEPKRAKSTPTLAVRSSNSGLPGQGKEDRKATGPSSFSGAELCLVAPRHSLCTASPKANRANISVDEEQQFKEAAKIVLSLTENAIAVRLKRGDFVEAKADEQEV
jgi:hypothetical protein